MSPDEVRQQSKKIIIIGTREFGQMAFDYFSRDSQHSVVAFAVNREFLGDQDKCCDLPVIACEDLAAHYTPAEYSVFVAMTYSQLNRDRARVAATMRESGYDTVSYVSSHAFVADNVDIGGNVFVFEDNTVQHRCCLEDNVILWSGNHIGHSSVIRQNCFISSHVVVSGGCDIGANSFVGVNATIGNDLTIGSDCTIGAGAVITRSVPENSVVAPTHSAVRENASRRLWKVQE